MNHRWTARLALLMLSAAGCGLALHAHAQGYPNKPVTFYVPFGPGSGKRCDLAHRRTENQRNLDPAHRGRKPAGGFRRHRHGAHRQKPNRTVTPTVIASTSHIVNQFVSKVRYDMLKDFAPVSITGSMPYVVAVTQSSSAKSMNELIAFAKARPGKINYAAVPGAVPHFMGEMLKSARGLDIMMIPYKSTTDAEVDVIAGRVEIWFTTMASALPLMKGNRVRILGVSGDKRAAVLPDVPTMTEAGLPSGGCHRRLLLLGPRRNAQACRRRAEPRNRQGPRHQGRQGSACSSRRGPQKQLNRNTRCPAQK